MAAEDAVAAKKRRRLCTGGGVGEDMMSALPEHVLQEVLFRVGTVRDLFKLAATCRRWLGRFTDRAFLREILWAWMGRRKDAAQQLASACSFLPAPGSPLGPGPTARALTSSLVADGRGAYDYAVPLAARRGIVLMQRVPCRRDSHLLLGVCNPITGQRHLLLGVCNPITGQRHLLEPLQYGDPTKMRGYAIITAADADADAAGGFTFSQLLVATVDTTDRRAVHLHSYSAATRSWSAPTLCLANGRGFYPAKGQRSAVIHQGAAHWLWLYRDTGGQRAGDDDLYKLSVQLGGAAAGPICFAFTRIPVRGGGNPLLCVTGDGELAVVCTYIWHVAVSTCRQQQKAGGGHAESWERTAFTIPAAVPYPDTPPLRQPIEKWFHLSRGSMLVLYRSSAVFVVDLHSKTMENVMDCFLHLFADQLNRTAVPYEMDLVDSFMSKLGGLSFTGSSG
ncbi:unnamed protein product [Urochloa decumbens]|uniref:F-box domain-containing protein n=1 Tax=Urochloa decumbens TaxID=240449 RepID=A0ABC9G7W6_9POAL